MSRAALSGSRPVTSSGARGARSGATGLAEEDAACYLECELLLYGSAGAYAVARRRLLDWRQNDFAVRAIQVASAKRFGWAKQTERRQMTESEGATKMQRGFRRFLKQKQIESGERHTRPKVSSRVSGLTLTLTLTLTL